MKPKLSKKNVILLVVLILTYTVLVIGFVETA